MRAITKRIIFGTLLLIPLFCTPSLSQGTFDIPKVEAQAQPVGQTQNNASQAVQQALGSTPSSNPATNAASSADKQMNDLINILVQLVKSLLVLILPLNILIGKLLSNDWVYLDGDAYQAIQTIWILVRNMVNIIFAAILLMMAISQIMGAATGSVGKNMELKQILPKFILGLIFVNFSLLTCRVILDVGNLASTAAFSIANETGKNLFASNSTGAAIDDPVMKKFYCWPTSEGQQATKDCLKNNSNPTAKDLETCQNLWLASPDPKMRNCMGEKLFVAFGNPAVKNLYAQTNNKEKIVGEENGDMAMAWSDNPPSNIGSALFGSRNVMFVYTNNIFRLPELLLLYDSQKTPGNNLAKVEGILIQTFLSLLYGAGILLVNVAFFLALAVRLVLIWMLLIFSPLMALEIVYPDKIKGIIGKAKFTKGMLKSLVDLSLMPAMVGIVLSVGFIIFSVLTTIINKTTGGATTTPGGIPKEVYKIPPFSVEVSGSPLGNVFSTMGEFIVAIIILVVLWEAVFYMMQTGTMVDGVVKKIKGIGDSLAGSAKMIPFIPMPGGRDKKDGGPKFISAGSLGYATRALENTLARHEQTAAEKGLGGTWVGDILGVKEMNEKEKDLYEKQQDMKVKGQTHFTPEHFQESVKGFVEANKIQTKDPKLLASTADGLSTMLAKSGIKEEKFITDFNNAIKAWARTPNDETLQKKVREMIYEMQNQKNLDPIAREALTKINVFDPRFREHPEQVIDKATSTSSSTSTTSTTTNNPTVKVTNTNYVVTVQSTPPGAKQAVSKEIPIQKTNTEIQKVITQYQTVRNADASKQSAPLDAFVGHLKNLDKEKALGLKNDTSDESSTSNREIAKNILNQILDNTSKGSGEK